MMTTSRYGVPGIPRRTTLWGAALVALLLLGDRAAADEGADRGIEVLSLLTHRQYHTVAFSPDGKRVAAGGTDKRLLVWDACTGEEMLALTGHRGDVIDVAFSPDGKWLASSAADGARLWEADTGKPALVLGTRGTVPRLAFTPDSRHLATAGMKLIAVWDVSSGQEIGLFRGHTHWVSTLAYSPDGRFLASGSIDRSMRFLEASGSELWTNRVHAGSVHSLAFSPDGKRLASASVDKTIRLWEASTGATVLTLTGHTSGVHSVAFSPDGRRLASSSSDRTVKLWDLRTRQEILTLTGHTGPVYSVAFSPDGRRLASTGNDGTVKIWSLGLPDAPEVHLSLAEQESLWTDLAGADNGKSFHAILTLSTAPRQTLPLLKQRLRHATLPLGQEKRVAQLLADLDDFRFAVRRRATAELEDLGKGAEPALRGLLEERPALEVRQRAERLLERLKTAPPTPEQLLAQHAVEVLERLGTPEARDLLETLAKGAVADWLTQEARDCVKRLPARVSPEPRSPAPPPRSAE